MTYFLIFNILFNNSYIGKNIHMIKLFSIYLYLNIFQEYFCLKKSSTKNVISYIFLERVFFVLIIFHESWHTDFYNIFKVSEYKKKKNNNKADVLFALNSSAETITLIIFINLH